MISNILLVADTQQQVAASRRLLGAGQRQRKQQDAIANSIEIEAV
jgi:hypothetical protein